MYPNSVCAVLDEVWTLLHGPEHAPSIDPSSTVPKDRCAYSRDEVCELESALCTTWLRLLLRYIIELEGLEISAIGSSFTKAQLLTFSSSLLALSQHLVPSLQRAVDSCFLVEQVQLLVSSPSMVFQTVALRLNKLVGDAQAASS
jgi:hypothetical protein